MCLDEAVSPHQALAILFELVSVLFLCPRYGSRFSCCALISERSSPVAEPFEFTRATVIDARLVVFVWLVPSLVGASSLFFFGVLFWLVFRLP